MGELAEQRAMLPWGNHSGSRDFLITPLRVPGARLDWAVPNDQIDEALVAGAPLLLLDNMNIAELRAAVAQVAGRAQLEASGGITLETLRAAASTGVDFVSVGALTHSAPALDVSLLLEPMP